MVWCLKKGCKKEILAFSVPLSARTILGHPEELNMQFD
ncbi:hypothetical protein SPBRAN_1151 [uncultured Candidatus Thioglobus sp.]|nr:hypothetical protein SPBRAN_1151 [uncultured Candidatus Thioglobus sp.]